MIYQVVNSICTRFFRGSLFRKSLLCWMETPVVPSSSARYPPLPRVTPVLLRAPHRLFALHHPLEELLEVHHEEHPLITPARPSAPQSAPSLTAVSAAVPVRLHPLPPRPAAQLSRAPSTWPPTRPTSPRASSPPWWCHSARSPRPAAPLMA